MTKLSPISVVIAVIAATSSAFTSPRIATAFVRSPTNTATTLQSAAMKELIPPLPRASDPNEDVQALYNENVQTTYGRYPLTIASGKGCWLYTTDGKEYLDFVSGIATCILGHSNEFLAKALADQMNEVHHVSNLYYIPQQARLAKWLCDNSAADRAFFCNSGAEANEAAMKLARKYAVQTRGITDPYIITALNSFHGRTLAALSATGQKKYHKGFTFGKEMVPGYVYTEYNNVDQLKELVEQLNETPPELEAEGRKRGVAAIMLECLQGEGGVVPGDPEYFSTARQLCDDSGALLIFDEVQIGMGRTGTLWGYENMGVEPDVFTSAKALGGGVPIGAMLATEKAAVFSPGEHASTYGGNPLACAAGLAVAEQMISEKVLENVRARGEQIRTGLEKIAEEFPMVVGEVRGLGLIQGIEILPDSDTSAGDIVAQCMKDGLLLVPAGANVVRFVPPLIVTKEQVDMALEKVSNAISSQVVITN